MKKYPVNHIDIPNGETIAYRMAGGDGPVMVLIHGNISSSVHWQTIMEQLEGEYRIYAPDLRGFGDSTYNKGFDCITELADDVKQFIDALGIVDFFIVGWSAGGPVAAEVAADWPERVKHLVLLCSGALTGFPYARVGEDDPPIDAAHPVTKEEINNHAQLSMLRLAIEGKQRPLLRTICDMSLYINNKPDEDEYEQYLDVMVKQRCKTDIDYALIVYNMTDVPNMVAREGSGRIALLRGPITILQAENDIVVPLIFGQGTKDLLGDRAELIIMPGLGHSPMTDDLAMVCREFRQACR